MKSRANTVIAVVLALLMMAAVFTACGKNSGDETTTTLLPDDMWTPGDEVYTPVEISDVELAEIVKQALGDDASDFDGDLSSLSKDQLSKVKQVAALNGYVVSADGDGKTVIMKDNVPVTEVPEDVANDILKEAGVEKNENLTPSQYERVSKVAEEKGVTAVTKDDGSVTMVEKVSTTAASTTSSGGSNDKTTSIIAGDTSRTTSTTRSSGTTSSGGNSSGGLTQYTFTTENATAVITSKSVTATKGNVYTGKSNVAFNSDAQATDGTLIAVGSTMTDKSGKESDHSNALIVKYTKDGSKDWEYILSGDGLTTFEDVAVLSDGSIIAVGHTLAKNLVSDASYKCKGTVEGVVCKFTSAGKLEWIRIVGGSGGDMIYAVCETGDGGFVIGGKSNSTDGDLKNAGANAIKAFVGKFDGSGNSQWSSFSSLSGSKHNSVNDLVVASDGSVYAAIESVTFDGDYSDLDAAKNKTRFSVITKFSSTGSVMWRKDFYEGGTVLLKNLCIGNDGGVVTAGYYSSGKTGANTGSFKSIHNGGPSGTYDGIIIKIDASGSVKWRTPLIGFDSDIVTGITRINGGYAVTGYTKSTNRDFAFSNYGDYDSFVYTITNGGTTQAYTSLGGSNSDRALHICGSGKEVTVCGVTASSDNDFSDIGSTNSDKSCGFIYKFEIDQSK